MLHASFSHAWFKCKTKRFLIFFETRRRRRRRSTGQDNRNKYNLRKRLKINVIRNAFFIWTSSNVTALSSHYFIDLQVKNEIKDTSVHHSSFSRSKDNYQSSFFKHLIVHILKHRCSQKRMTYSQLCWHENNNKTKSNNNIVSL